MNQGITRRRLLQAMGLSSGAALLAGCNAMPTIRGSLDSMVGKALGGSQLNQVNARSNGLRPWSAEDQQKAVRAKWVLDEIAQTGKMPWVPTENAYPDQVEEFTQTWTNIIAKSQARGEIAFGDYLTVAVGGTPLFAQGTMQDDGALPTGGGKARVSNGVVNIPPGARVRFSLNGACMDDGLPAPARGEQLTIRPLQGYIHPQLTDLYRGVNRQYTAGALRFNDYQHLIWAIRNVETKDTPYIANLKTHHVEALNQAAPGGANLLRRTHMMEANNPLNDIADNLSSAFGEALGSLQLNINGQSLSATDLMQQGNTDQAIEGILNTLTSQEPRERVPAGDLSDFTVLDNGLVVQSRAAKQLSPGFTIANPTSTTLGFDPSGYVAESRRDTQRLSIPYVADDMPLDTDEPGIGENDYVGNFFTRFIKDLYLFTVDSGLRNAYELRDRGARILTSVRAKWAPIMDRPIFKSVIAKVMKFEPLARKTVDYLPVVGNMMSLYEVVAGHHFLEQDNPSSMPERGLALIGVIPGGRMAVKGVSSAVNAARASDELSRKARLMAESYKNSAIIKGITASEVYRDVAWWTVADAHEELAVAGNERWQNRFTDSWRDTIEYVKAL